MSSPTVRSAYYAILEAIHEWRKQPTKARPIHAQAHRTRRMKKVSSKTNRKVEAAQ